MTRQDPELQQKIIDQMKQHHEMMRSIRNDTRYGDDARLVQMMRITYQLWAFSAINGQLDWISANCFWHYCNYGHVW